MTYLDKIMQAIKFDDELLTREEIRSLRVCVKHGIFNELRPWDFSFVIGNEFPEDWRERGAWLEKKRIPQSRTAWDVDVEIPLRRPARPARAKAI